MSDAQTNQPHHISNVFNEQYYTRAQLEDSPSRRDGVDAPTIASFRRKNVVFIQRLAAELKLRPAWARSIHESAVVAVERFFARRSYANSDRFLVCAAALFLAAKAQDSARPIRHVAEAFLRVKHANNPQFLAALDADAGKKLEETKSLIEGLLLAEEALLITVGYNLCDYDVRNPLSEYLAAMGVFTLRNRQADDVPANNLTPDQQRRISHVAVDALLPEIFRTQLPLQYPPSKVAVALVTWVCCRLGWPLAPPSEEVLADLSAHHLDTSFVVTDTEYQDIMEQVLSQSRLAEVPRPAQEQQQPVSAAHAAAPLSTQQLQQQQGSAPAAQQAAQHQVLLPPAQQQQPCSPSPQQQQPSNPPPQHHQQQQQQLPTPPSPQQQPAASSQAQAPQLPTQPSLPAAPAAGQRVHTGIPTHLTKAQWDSILMPPPPPRRPSAQAGAANCTSASGSPVFSARLHSPLCGGVPLSSTPLSSSGSRKRRTESEGRSEQSCASMVARDTKVLRVA